ncbi:MAG: hypothetical protein CMF75_01935 [Maricaulis sp.]|nr:hypothetical protein [Maricaulis sp.]
MKSLPVFLIAIGLAGCVTTGSSPDPAAAHAEARIAPTESARLADATARELAHLARFDPDLLDTVYPELRALAAALVGASAAAQTGEAAGLPHAAMAPQVAAPSAMDASGLMPPDGQSLLHAVHLASYRREDMALRGWQELQATYPVLADLDARLELAHIPEQGDFLRLKAGPFDTASAAQAVCRQMEASGQYCRATDYTGQALADGTGAHE